MRRMARGYTLGCLALLGCSSPSASDGNGPNGGGESRAGSAGAGISGTSGAGTGANLGGESSAGAAASGLGGEGGADPVGGNSNAGGGAGAIGTAGSGGAGGGTASGGTASGGTASGGSASGGKTGSGGAGGGSASGGNAACETSAPPSTVAAWIDESWNGQLGNNVKTRKAWNLDNVMLNQGKLNLCVRWGATSAVPKAVIMDLESTIARWFNDWFKALGSYDCFPYPNGITVKVTGWAVKPGKQALLSGIDPAIPVYTETDPDGEPKCPDACSSFVHWDHVFTSCAGGPANHSDYWLWFDDALPGGGNAAAVGGDWGLRMPVATFTDHFNDPSFLIAEHEMGHGFGFQDYYDWTGSRPAGGSLMIVGSTGNLQSPTVGDTWLLRRTWREVKALRGF